MLLVSKVHQKNVESNLKNGKELKFNDLVDQVSHSWNALDTQEKDLINHVAKSNWIFQPNRREIDINTSKRKKRKIFLEEDIIEERKIVQETKLVQDQILSLGTKSKHSLAIKENLRKVLILQTRTPESETLNLHAGFNEATSDSEDY